MWSLKYYLFLCCAPILICSNQDVVEKIPSFLGDENGKEAVLLNTKKRINMFMDETVSPCDNFYKYTCGNFGRYYPLSKEKSEISIDSIVEEQLTASTKKFLELPLEGNLNLRDVETKARLFYRDCVDVDTRQERGFEPMVQFINTLGGWHVFNQTWEEDRFDIIELLGKLSHYNAQIILQITLHRYMSVTGEHYLIIWEGRGRTTPARDILSSPFEVERYENFVREVLLLAGAAPDIIDETTNDVVKFEIELTKLLNTPKNITNPSGIVTLEEVQSTIPKIDWERLLRVAFKRTVHPKQKVELLNYRYFHDLQNLLAQSSKRTLANYIFWKTIVDFGGMLDERIKDARKRYTNDTKSTSIQKYCTDLITYTMPDAAHLYWLKENSKSTSKQEVAEMAEVIRQTFVEGITGNTWLDVKTRKKLLERIESMVLEVGCPYEKCLKTVVNRKFKSLTIIPNKFFESAINAIKKRRMGQLGRLNMKARFSWFVCGKSLNAFYMRNENKIVVPTGLLNPPFYNPSLPAAINFGIMGWLLAHEITHGFDNTGTCNGCTAKDKENWTNESAKEFQRLAECFVDQFNSYKLYNISIRGNITQKENIADTTGLRFAYRSYLKWLEANPSEKKPIVGSNGSHIPNEQLFFLSFGHLWCSAATEKSINVTIRLDKHSPPEIRVVGSLSNSPEFAEVFKCPVGSNMNPEKKCNIW